MADLPDDEQLRRLLVCDDRCQDWSMHEFYIDRPFRWKRPTLHHVRPAADRLWVGLNRYPHNVIGVGVSWRGHGLTLNWKGSHR